MLNFLPFSQVLSPMILAVSLLFMILYGALRPQSTYQTLAWLGLFICLAVMDVAAIPFVGDVSSVRVLSFVFDDLSSSTVLVLCVLMIIFFALTLRLSWPFEAALLVLFSLLGMMLMVSADSLMAFYVGLEMQSLALYVFIAMHNQNNPLAIEASLKYFILGALASGLMLFGMSLLYGQFGSVSYMDLQTSLLTLNAASSLWAQVAATLLLVGFLFKLSIVPFHIWTPDVYQGSPTPVVAFLSSLPKVAATAALVRLATGPLHSIMPDMVSLLQILAGLSMAWGALAGLRQTNVKRLLAYSTIAQMGFILMGISVATPESLGSALTYSLVYAATSLGILGMLMFIRAQDLEMIDITGLVKFSPASAYILAILLLSLAGMPFFAGFFTKLAVFKSVLAQGYYPIVVVAALSSVVAMYYYLRLIKLMIFDDPVSDQSIVIPETTCLPVGVIVALFVSIFFIFPGPDMLRFSESVVVSLLDAPLIKQVPPSIIITP